VVKFLSGLDIFLDNQVRVQVLSGDTVPSLFTTMSRVCRISMRGDSCSGGENSAMVAGGRDRGRGRDRGHDSGEDVDAKIRVYVIVLIVV